MKGEELKGLRKKLIELRRKLANNVNHMQTEALRVGGETLNEPSDLPMEHLADRGSDNFAKDLMIGILQNSEAEICEIDAALQKIESGVYGVCEGCKSPMDRARLEALPYARLCMKCKQAEESNSRG